MKYFELLIILTAINIVTGQSGYEKHILSNYSEAKCLDGTPYALHYQKGLSDKLIIGFEATHFCFKLIAGQLNLSSCAHKVKNGKMSSENAPEELVLGGLMSNDSKLNPVFNEYSKIVLSQCDGVGNQIQRSGSVVENNTHLYFRGHDNILAVLDYAVQKFGLLQASEVILVGHNFSGITAVQWVDYIKEFITKENKQIKVSAIVDTIMYLDDQSYVFPSFKFAKAYAQSLQVFTDGQPIDETCKTHYSDNLWKCFMPQNLLKFVKSDVLILDSYYNRIYSETAIGITDCTSYPICEQYKDTKTIREYGTEIREFLSYLNRFHSNFFTVFYSTPQNHLRSFLMHTDYSSNRFIHEGININQFIQKFINGEKFTSIENIEQEIQSKQVEKTEKMSEEQMVGIIVGSLVGVAIIATISIVLVVRCYKKKIHKYYELKKNQNEVQNLRKSSIDQSNPTLQRSESQNSMFSKQFKGVEIQQNIQEVQQVQEVQDDQAQEQQ